MKTYTLPAHPWANKPDLIRMKCCGYVEVHNAQHESLLNPIPPSPQQIIAKIAFRKFCSDASWKNSTRFIFTEVQNYTPGFIETLRSFLDETNLPDLYELPSFENGNTGYDIHTWIWTIDNKVGKPFGPLWNWYKECIAHPALGANWSKAGYGKKTLGAEPS